VSALAAMTWAALDVLAHDDPLAVGLRYAVRYANFAVRMPTWSSRLPAPRHQSNGYTQRGAKIVMVDIDAAEIGKFARLDRQSSGIEADAKVPCAK
jgi:hypothetical protein